MLRHRARLATAILVIALLLFAGRWTATFLADQWWASQFSPAAAAFSAQIHLLKLTLDIAGVLCASAWFVGNLLVVARAVGSVQVPRHVANIEFRETVTPGTLVSGAVGGGVILGLLIGLDTSDLWPTLALAWRGVTYGVTEPLLGRDAGFYVAQLPLWRTLHAMALLLALVALATVVASYSVIGAVRIIGSRLAVNGHARTHIGWLLAALALCLGWGYLLEPYELVSGGTGMLTRQRFDLVSFVAPALAGTALMVAVLSALWALRPRHALIAAGWVVLLVASVAGHYGLPLLVRRQTTPAVSAATARRFEELAFGLEQVRESHRASPAMTPPHWPSLWDAGSAPRAVAIDTGGAITADQAVISVARERRPAWLVLRRNGAATEVVALADDRVTGSGAPLYYRAGDSLAYPTPYAYVELSPSAARPGAPPYALGTAVAGAPVGSAIRRIALAWALQAPELLGGVPATSRLEWRLQPAERLQALLPFATWAPSVSAVIEGRIVWLSDGFVSSESFPLVDLLSWRRGWSNTVRAAYLGTVDAETGQTHIYRRGSGGPLADAWSSAASGVVEDSRSVPPLVRAAQSYPLELFRLQALVLERATWGPGQIAARPTTTPLDPARPQPAWRADERGIELLVGFDRGGRRTAALLAGSMNDGRESLEVVRLDSASSLSTPAVLAARWSRFPTYAQLRDSIVAAGSRLEGRPVNLWLGPDGVGAMQSHIAGRPGTRPSIAWVAMATHERLGAARTLGGAWDNLRGASGPLPPGAGGGQSADAQRWMRIADAALRRGDWAAFGRAFDALRLALDAHADSAAR